MLLRLLLLGRARVERESPESALRGWTSVIPLSVFRELL